MSRCWPAPRQPVPQTASLPVPGAPSWAASQLSAPRADLACLRARWCPAPSSRAAEPPLGAHGWPRAPPQRVAQAVRARPAPSLPGRHWLRDVTFALGNGAEWRQVFPLRAEVLLGTRGHLLNDLWLVCGFPNGCGSGLTTVLNAHLLARKQTSTRHRGQSPSPACLHGWPCARPHHCLGVKAAPSLALLAPRLILCLTTPPPCHPRPGPGMESRLHGLAPRSQRNPPVPLAPYLASTLCSSHTRRLTTRNPDGWRGQPCQAGLPPPARPAPLLVWTSYPPRPPTALHSVQGPLQTRF